MAVTATVQTRLLSRQVLGHGRTKLTIAFQSQIHCHSQARGLFGFWGSSAHRETPPSRFKADNKEALRLARAIRQRNRAAEEAESEFGTEDIHWKGRSHEISKIDYTKYDYPFENLVFEGGGSKGIVYIGALEVLEEVGIKPKRYAGSSAGAMVAALAAVGFSVDRISAEIETDLHDLLMDHHYGYLSLLPNMIRSYGWNPGNKLVKKFGDLFEEKTGNADITFKQLYDMTGTELCVVAVNVNMRRAEYFHPKTTPDVPLRLAVRMSMSIPGVFQAVPMITHASTIDYYVDGGVLCNYPIHAYDGMWKKGKPTDEDYIQTIQSWWLSMAMEDSFLNRIQPLSDFSKFIDKKKRFGTRNEKTLGFIVYSSKEQDVMKEQLESRVGLRISDDMRPNTKLCRQRVRSIEAKDDAVDDHEIFVESMGRFLKRLQEVEGISGEKDDVTEKEELRAVLDNAAVVEHYEPAASEFNTYDVSILFGDDHNVDEIFDAMSSEKNGKITYEDLVKFVSRSGVNINKKYQGYDRQETKRLSQFFTVLTSSWLTNTTKMYIEADDFYRTVGINSDYIETMDFSMEDDDKNFAKLQGRRSTESFLRHHVYRNKLQPKSSSS